MEPRPPDPLPTDPVDIVPLLRTLPPSVSLAMSALKAALDRERDRDIASQQARRLSWQVLGLAAEMAFPGQGGIIASTVKTLLEG